MAATQAKPCTPEPTDMVISLGELILCQIESKGAAGVFRFNAARNQLRNR